MRQNGRYNHSAQKGECDKTGEMSEISHHSNNRLVFIFSCESYNFIFVTTQEGGGVRDLIAKQLTFISDTCARMRGTI